MAPNRSRSRSRSIDFTHELLYSNPCFTLVEVSKWNNLLMLFGDIEIHNAKYVNFDLPFYLTSSIRWPNYLSSVRHYLNVPFAIPVIARTEYRDPTNSRQSASSQHAQSLSTERASAWWLRPCEEARAHAWEGLSPSWVRWALAHNAEALLISKIVFFSDHWQENEWTYLDERVYDSNAVRFAVCVLRCGCGWVCLSVPGRLCYWHSYE